MHLRRLAIHALPGIEPGFTFEPPDADIIVVTGPNAIGKSSLARALQYLLASRGSDPPALSLEAELQSTGARWRVSRNGSQIVWRRDGEVVPAPLVPGADRFGLFRLSVEHLLDDDDANDRELAERLWRELHGNLDLSRPRIELGSKFAAHEARLLARAGGERRRVEGEYVDLQRRETELPDLERRIAEATAAGVRGEQLRQALTLADAIEARKAREADIRGFPPNMERLRGDEIERLEAHEKRTLALNEELRTRRRELEAAQADVERSGLAQRSPAPEEVQSAEERLRRLGEQSVERGNLQAALTEAGAELRETAAQFSGDGDPPRLDAEAFGRAEEIAWPLVEAQARRSELQAQIELVGEAPEAAEVERWREGVEALRAWLAGNAAESGLTRALGGAAHFAHWAGLALAALAAVAAFLAGALVASAGALAAFIAIGLVLFLQRARRPAAPPPTEEARRRFGETGLTPPPQWDEQAVRQHLREAIESRLNALTIRQTRAAGSERIAHRIRETDERIEALEQRRVALAAEIGFDPSLPVAEFQRFVQLCAAWDRARTTHARQGDRLELLDREMAQAARLVGDFLDGWRASDAPAPDDTGERPDLTRLRSAFDDLKRRIEAAGEAGHRIRTCESEIRSLKQRIEENDASVESLFATAGVELRNRADLTDRIERLEPWKAARDALHRAATEEHLARDQLAERSDLVALAGGGERARLQAELEASTREAGEVASLIQRQTEIRTRLDDAGRDRRLEEAAAGEDRARQALEDKRDEALLAVTTRTLLDDVERAFEAEHEPAVLRRAREVFADVTARDFDLRLRGDGTFVAHDVRLDAPRALSELSSGTRMQLLLSLRMAWIETLEQGGETLPLFLDEALTTSDEARFAVVARSLERLAGDRDGDAGGAGSDAAGASGVGAGGDTGRAAGGRRRQVFYLSARRHEPALWQQATGTHPAVIDLAAVRFRPRGFAPENYRVETPPALPAPDGLSAEEYGSLVGVPPRLDLHRPEGGMHPFHLLRDDLTLLHTLMDTWRVASLGQLEGLLASDAARAALPAEDMRRRLQQRCRVVRTWFELARRGRGRRVDRGVLELSGAVSAIFIDQTADLAERAGGDGEALVNALHARELSGFRTRKIDELERWLADEGYIDDQERLTAEDRRRLALQTVALESTADAADANRVLSWLEASASQSSALSIDR